MTKEILIFSNLFFVSLLFSVLQVTSSALHTNGTGSYMYSLLEECSSNINCSSVSTSHHFTSYSTVLQNVYFHLFHLYNKKFKMNFPHDILNLYFYLQIKGSVWIYKHCIHLLLYIMKGNFHQKLACFLGKSDRLTMCTYTPLVVRYVGQFGLYIPRKTFIATVQV